MKKTNLIILLALLNVVTWGVACNSSSGHRKKATEVIIHSDKPIVIETLHSGSLRSGIYKVEIDGSEYVYVRAANGVSIVKHK